MMRDMLADFGYTLRQIDPIAPTPAVYNPLAFRVQKRAQTSGVITPKADFIFREGAAMEFKDIAKAMGISVSCAHAHYRNAMRKIRNYPEMVSRLVELVEERNKVTEDRTYAVN